ncbi:6-carboxyhexanoate--CoA ligase [Desulfuromonas sp. TF]|uniref:6-carboxyhexanoate--CoA ligase n=1 Tax=Desulfuromonas sp. TF TaxID=1232410 RepID=UPI0009DEABBC|nr:6-carboxyhexanoate--CoA ligase [Desulfuromonas sp. TF]
MDHDLYSVRMHASRGGRHLSGAERLGAEEDLEGLAASLLRRALEHPKGRAERICLTVEAVAPEAVRTGRLPDLSTLTVEDYRKGRRAALALLADAGVDPAAADIAMQTLAAGAAPEGSSMRGAMLVDAADGLRLEPDRTRGVRACRMDLTPAAALRLREGLAPLGLDNLHVREALVLAAKVLSAPGIVAELCWSDDPDYTAGYVASPTHGYVRFPHLKPLGDERGGRAFFLQSEGLDVEEVIDYLEHAVFLIDEIGALHGPRPWKE